MEVDLVLESISSLPKVEFELIFFNLSKNEIVIITFNEDKKIINCSPEDSCNYFSVLLHS